MCGIFAYLNFLTPRSRSYNDIFNDNYTGNDNDFMMIVLLKGSHQEAGHILMYTITMILWNFWMNNDDDNDVFNDSITKEQVTSWWKL